MNEENASTTASPSAADTRNDGSKNNNTLTGSRVTSNNDRGYIDRGVEAAGLP